MKTIPSEIHARLTASERIRAAVSALSRGDDAEIQTLKETCPVKTFTMTDPAYGEAMQRLLALSMAVESDLNRTALDFFMACRLKTEDLEPMINTIGAIQKAWAEFLSELGIPQEEMAAAGPSQHPAMIGILQMHDPEDIDPEAVQILLAYMRDYFAA